jgi:hypothetical protein
VTRRSHRARALALLAALAWPGVDAAAGDGAPTEAPAPKPEAAAAATPAPAPPADVDAALQRGVAHLIATQNKDGSWGTPASNLWDIYAPAPGSQQTFAVAVTALALSGLLEAADTGVPGTGGPEVKAAVERARTWLLAKHAVGRPTTDVLYNTWAHAYSLEAFSRLLARETDAQRRAENRAAAEVDAERIQRFQFVEGGWGYYNFSEQTKSPGPGSTSFTTATCLVAMAMAKAQGVAVPERIVPKALRDLEACAYPDGSFAYGYYIHLRPRMPVNQMKGSLARTPACLLAFDVWGKKVDAARADRALENLEKEGHFLRIARKYPFPHETWYQNSGYFCFYGYYYASALLALASPEVRAKHAPQIAAHMVPLQEKDGSWWDYQLYGYHKAYGTGFVLTTLARCRAITKSDAAKSASEAPAPAK